MQLFNLEEFVEVIEDLHLRMSVEEFAEKLLSAAMNMISGLDHGTLLLNKERKWKVIASKGFDPRINELKLDEDLLSELNENPIVMDDMPKALKKIKDGKSLDLLTRVGADRFKVVIGVGISVDEKIKGGLFLGSTKPFKPTEEDLRLVKAFGKLASIFLSMKLFQEKERGYQREIILAMVKAMEARDPYTVGHSERVALYAVEIAKHLGCERETIDRIYWGALIHDIGKLAVPEHILLKPSPLLPREFEYVKRHPIVGEDMIKDYPWLENLKPIVRHHHERWDGKGYPDGIPSKELPTGVRIVTIADAFDAMTSERAYRKARTVEEALQEIEREAGEQFDPEIARQSLSVLEGCVK